MMLTTKGRYAVMAMTDLAQYHLTSKAVSLKDIAERQEITVGYLEQIFSKLKKNNLVEGMKGPGGGYILTKNAKDISVLEVIDAVGESIKITRCDNKNKTCLIHSNQKCLTHSLWDGLGKKISGYLGSISLQDLCNDVKL